MSRTRQITIIQAGGETLRVVRASIDAQGVRLADACSFWSRGKDQDGSCLQDQTVIDALSAHAENVNLLGSDVVFVLGGSRVASQYLDLPPLAGSALRQAAMLKLGQQLHFPVEESVVALRPVGSSKSGEAGQQRLQVTAAHQDIIDAAMNLADRFGFRVLGICASADVLAAAAAAHAEPGSGLHAVLEFEEKHSTLVVLHGGDPCVCAEIPLGAADITAALMRPIICGEDVVQLNEEKATLLRNEIGIPEPTDSIPSIGVTGDRLLPLLEPFIQKTLKQLTQWLSFAATTTGSSVTSMELVGSGASIPGLAKAFAARSSLQVRTCQWLEQLATTVDGTADAPSSPGLIAAAARYWKETPDLVPPAVRREQRLARVRRMVAFSGPIVAAAIIAFALSVDRLDVSVTPRLPLCREQLSNIEQSMARHNALAAEAKGIKGLEKQFTEFGDASPNWVAVFKELSILLPSELQATEFIAERDADNMVLTIRASVMTGGRGRDFDEVVRQTLVLLQRSAFFKRVEMVSANRDTSGAAQAPAGVLAVRLDLVVPQTAARPRA